MFFRWFWIFPLSIFLLRDCFNLFRDRRCKRRFNNIWETCPRWFRSLWLYRTTKSFIFDRETFKSPHDVVGRHGKYLFMLKIIDNYKTVCRANWNDSPVWVKSNGTYCRTSFFIILSVNDKIWKDSTWRTRIFKPV